MTDKLLTMHPFESAIVCTLKAENARLLAENKKLREALEWRPIETAPKNGTTILLSNGTWINFGRWHRHLYGRGSPGWVINDCGTVERITHWMPLPHPPETETSDD